MKPVFRLSHVTKKYRKQVALDDVSLESGPGMVIALLGENGAGKSTALKILMGLVEADKGDASVFGLDSRTQGEEIRRRVGYVPEQITLYDWMTVGEIGWFSAGFYPVSYMETYRGLIRQFELPEDRKIKNLSKGMRAKVSWALAMSHQPDLLILDEPTSGLDSMVRREFLESMVDVAAEGRTVLLSSHQIHEVERVADMVAIIRHGKLVLCERLDELKQDVRELTVTLRNGSLDIPNVPGIVIRKEQLDRQWRMLVRGLDENRLETFRTGQNIQHVELRPANLEEIFVGYMRSEDE